MHETLVVLAVIALACAVTAAGSLPALAIVQAGESVMLGSASFGIPLELAYFGLLWIALRLGPEPIPRGWFWRPFVHHPLLTSGARCAVLPVFFSGALAFVGIVLGMAIVVVGMLAGLRT
jgi:hypothetical protein